MIWSHEKQLGIFREQSKWTTWICITRNTGRKAIFTNEMGLGKCANGFIQTFRLAYLNIFRVECNGTIHLILPIMDSEL